MPINIYSVLMHGQELSQQKWEIGIFSFHLSTFTKFGCLFEQNYFRQSQIKQFFIDFA